ncbi:hypothetical protein UFOVP579_19 [uncultured Caudovirales phage]|uniref:Uncharacterized protein n=1 Tax=uncultured Caudovirales phage TaxID=2100421 RepID=A0A6J5PBU3_9CAUD|nr:hypothetical protein UFOVP302_19 [uncultured Caudovirales phage]CAB4168677.1 hypothetical protein UFOVP579_19 [uncultured Caudovirales phage]
MAGIKDAIFSIMEKLTNDVPALNFVRIWNNQLSDETDGKTYDFPKPAAFVEISTPNQHHPLGGGFSQADLEVIIHLVTEDYDMTDGTFEQFTQPYEIKALINAALTNYQPTQCSSLMRKSESQDYDHTNLYHYQITYICALIDTEGVPGETLSEPPNNFIVEAQIDLNP